MVAFTCLCDESVTQVCLASYSTTATDKSIMETLILTNRRLFHNQINPTPQRSRGMSLFTWEGLRGFTSHFPVPVAIAVASVVDPVVNFVPLLSDLVEGPVLRLLALICPETPGNKAELVESKVSAPGKGELQTHRSGHISSVRGPLQSRCSSSCVPQCGAWRTLG